MSDNLKKQYRDLEMKVLSLLTIKIQESNSLAEYSNNKALHTKCEKYGLGNIIFINEKLTFEDSTGLHYSIFNSHSLEELIDTINS